MNRVTVVCVSAGIDDNPLCPVKVGILNSVDNGSLMVGLEHFNL